MNDVEVDAGASDDVGDAGGDEEGQAVGPGESRVCCEAAPVQSSPHCWRLPPPSGLRTLTLGVTAPSLPCSTTDFTKVGIFSWFLACREPPGHLAGRQVEILGDAADRSPESTPVLASFKRWQKGREN